MVEKEAGEDGGGATTTTAASSISFDLPEEVLEVLPSDPFEQLDVARKITSIALSTRVSSLEAESASLRAQLADRDNLISDLHSQIESLDSSLSAGSHKLSLADQDKDNLLRENASLSNTVRKLQRDVSKLEVFRKTLMQSLQEDDDSSVKSTAGGGAVGAQHIIAKPTPSEDDAMLPPLRSSSTASQFSEVGSPYAEDRTPDASRPAVSMSMLLASQTSTPKLTPPGSPPSFSASASPTRSSKSASPRRNAMSFATSRGMPDDRFSSLPPSQYSSVSSSDTASQSGRARVDGKEFFRQVRSRLSYEQFGAFLANVKELNSHKQSKEETLWKAEEIFGSENKDLYVIFEGLISRSSVH